MELCFTWRGVASLWKLNLRKKITWRVFCRTWRTLAITEFLCIVIFLISKRGRGVLSVNASDYQYL